eukprot:1048741_1
MAASNRYNMPGVANTFMTLFKKKNEAHLKITPRGKSGKPHSIPCKSIKDNADVTMLWNKFKEQYKGELDTEIDKILLYSKKAERQKALNVLWKFKRDGHLKGQTTEQKTWNKKMYKAKWEQLIALVEAYRLPSHPNNKKNETKNKTNMKRKKKSKKPDDQLPLQSIDTNTNTRVISNGDQRTISPATFDCFPKKLEKYAITSVLNCSVTGDPRCGYRLNFLADVEIG